MCNSAEKLYPYLTIHDTRTNRRNIVSLVCVCTLCVFSVFFLCVCVCMCTCVSLLAYKSYIIIHLFH